MLGLRNLHHYLTECPKDSMSVYQVASDSKTWYFFCASGINFTGKIIELFEKNRLDEILINLPEASFMLMNVLYDIFYTNFNKYWLKKGIKSFMEFNTIFEEFFRNEADHYLNTFKRKFVQFH
jgi:hypothetical protein